MQNNAIIEQQVQFHFFRREKLAASDIAMLDGLPEAAHYKYYEDSSSFSMSKTTFATDQYEIDKQLEGMEKDAASAARKYIFGAMGKKRASEILGTELEPTRNS
jgi:hypothetical protein